MPALCGHYAYSQVVDIVTDYTIMVQGLKQRVNVNFCEAAPGFWGQKQMQQALKWSTFG